MNHLEYSFFFNKKIYSQNPESPISLLTESLFNKLNHSSRNIEIRKLSLNNILANLIISQLHSRYLVVSKSANEYSNYSWYGLSHYTFRLTVGWIEALLREGYINQILGFYDSNTGKGKRSRIYANEKLISVLNESKKNQENFSSLNYTKNIVLKDEGLIRYSPSGRLMEKIKFLNEYNEFISGNQILLQINSDTLSKINKPYALYNDSFLSFHHLLHAEVVVGGGCPVPSGIPYLITLDNNSLIYKQIKGLLYRVFNQGKFTRGGRFYGSPHQQLNENERAKIKINGSPVVEVDYSAFHLNMLYHLNGKQFNEDPYSVVDIPEVRPLLKVLCLIVINSKNKSQALRALQDEIRKNDQFQKLKITYHLDEKDLLRKFESVHSEISNYFCSSIGLKLMYKDSEIIETVLKHFTNTETPCLPIHDSFIVIEKHHEELKEVMNAVYKKYLGFDAKLK